MRFHDAQIDLSPHIADSGEAVGVHSKLKTVAEAVSLENQKYLLVENSRHVPVGIVSTERITQVLGSPHARERERWENMPIESIMDARFSETETVHSELPTTIDCQAVEKDGQIFAVTTETDVFVSWKTVQETLRFALVDPVTSLPNRSVFNNQLHAECNRASRAGTSVGVILIDIDYFKHVNDNYGHAAGDSILRLVSQSIRRNLRSYDIVARYGGDELAVICSGCRPGEIEIPITRLQKGVARIAETDDVPCPVPTLSIGACVVHSPEDMGDPATIISAADECLYHAKEAGRNCSFSTEIGQPPNLQSETTQREQQDTGKKRRRTD